MKKNNLAIVFSIFTLAAYGCAADDPTANDPQIQDVAIDGAACSPIPTYSENLSSCTPLATDYEPRDGGQTNGWDACISDDDAYHRIQESVSSISRVEAYDAIADMLWRDGATPTHEDFVAARVLFEEEQGLGSRVARRYDVHYPAPDTGSCEDEGVADANASRCVGPATLLPIVVAAFADGAQGQNRIVNALKIQAALQWFLYVSSVKEATTCTDTAKDCDSAWAYYSGGTTRDAPRGLAADIDGLSEETHDRAFDGVLAVRCWRDLDPAETATNLDLRDQAIGQLDKAVFRGMSLMLRQHFAALPCASGDYLEGHWQAAQIIGSLFTPLLRLQDDTGAPGDLADTIEAELAKDAGSADATAVMNAIDATLDCP